jgi:cell wall-associated NlpC family hydrolase
MKFLLWFALAALVAVITMVTVLARPQVTLSSFGPPTCTVPSGQPVVPAAPDPAGGGPGAYAGVTLSPAQMVVVQAILGTAKGMGITSRGAVISLQVAMQESRLNADAQSGHALGAFQQIAPGPYDAYAGYDPHDPAAAAKGFFTVLRRRDPGYDTDSRANQDIAQLVQASGAGADKYAPHQAFAEAVVAALYEGTGPSLACADQSVKGPIPVQIQGNQVTLPPQAGVAGTVIAASPQIAKAIGAGLAWLGTPYAWGGGDANGPTKGVSDNGGQADQHGDFNKIGFDCAGLTLYAYAQAGVTLTRPSDSQLTHAKFVVPYSQAQPGDLLFWGTHHVALYLGVIGNQHLILEAPESGEFVHVTAVRTGGDFRDVAARPIPGNVM